MSGLKDNKDKMRVELDWQFVEQMAKRMNENKDKYPRDNWKQPINIVELEDALIRHWFDYKRGDERENHLAAIALNAMMINYQKNNTLPNDAKITLKDNWNNEKINEYLKQIIERKEYKEYYKNIYTNNYLHDNPNESGSFISGSCLSNNMCQHSEIGAMSTEEFFDYLENNSRSYADSQAQDIIDYLLYQLDIKSKLNDGANLSISTAEEHYLVNNYNNKLNLTNSSSTISDKRVYKDNNEFIGAPRNKKQ